MEEAIALSKEVGEEVGARYAVPVFLYEKIGFRPLPGESGGDP